MNIELIMSSIAILIALVSSILSYHHILKKGKYEKISAKRIRNIYIVITICVILVVSILYTISVMQNKKETKKDMDEPKEQNQVAVQTDYADTAMPNYTTEIIENDTDKTDIVMFIQLKQTNIEVKWRDGSFSRDGYNLDVEKSIYLYGYEDNKNTVWTERAAYIDDGLYRCSIPSVEYNIFISGVESENQYIEKDNIHLYSCQDTPYSMYCKNEMYEIEWTKGSLDNVISINLLGSTNSVGHLDLVEDIESLRMTTGLYTICYENSYQNVIPIYYEGIHDFSGWPRS